MSQQQQDSIENHTRLFILGGKGCTEDDFKTTFGKFGTVKDVWIVKDRHTSEEKGIVYVTFEKVSEAALALEDMNGRVMANNPKPIKVLIANSRKEGAVRDPKEDEKMQRLFLIVRKDQTDSDIEKEFQQWGDIDYVRILKDRSSGESKGLAYVKYYRPYHAALALEQCDASYKAVFASNNKRPQSQGDRYQERGYSNYSSSYDTPSRGSDRRGSSRSYEDYSSPPQRYDTGRYNGSGPADAIAQYDHANERRLEVMATGGLTQEQLYRLFDLFPNLEFCNYDRATGMTYVKYSTPQTAAYVKDKLNGFEYPIGYRLAIRYPQNNFGVSRGDPAGLVSAAAISVKDTLQRTIQGADNDPEGLKSLVDAISKASTVLQQAGLVVGSGGGGGGGGGGASSSFRDDERVRWCNVALPLTKPLAARDTPIQERLFFISQPDGMPEHILHDMFCRFGELIDAYFMPGKNYGYAKYGSKESAEQAIAALHGQQVWGNRLKVMLADPPKHEREDEYAIKRPRT